MIWHQRNNPRIARSKQYWGTISCIIAIWLYLLLTQICYLISPPCYFPSASTDSATTYNTFWIPSKAASQANPDNFDPINDDDDDCQDFVIPSSLAKEAHLILVWPYSPDNPFPDHNSLYLSETDCRAPPLSL